MSLREWVQRIIDFFRSSEESVPEGCEHLPDITLMIRNYSYVDPHIEKANFRIRTALYAIMEHVTELQILQRRIVADDAIKKQIAARLAALSEISHYISKWVDAGGQCLLQGRAFDSAVTMMKQISIPPFDENTAISHRWFLYEPHFASTNTLQWNFYVRTYLYARYEHVTEIKQLIGRLDAVQKDKLAVFAEFTWRKRAVFEMDRMIPRFIADCDNLLTIGDAYLSAMEAPPILLNEEAWELLVERENKNQRDMIEEEENIIPYTIKRR